MNERAIRLHRSYGHDNMHERLRRLLYEAFFGVESAGPAPDFRGYGRPKLMLVSSAWRSGVSDRGDGKAERTSAPRTDLGGTASGTADAAERAPESDSSAAAREAWVKPSLHKMP